MEETEVACFLIEGSGEWETQKGMFSRHFPNLLFQLVDPRSGSNERFFRLIAAQTLKSSRDGSLLAKKREVDLLLRLARTTQISEALTKVGYKKGQKRVLIAAGKKGEVRRLVGSGLAKGRRLRAAELSEMEWGRVEEAAILSAQRP